MLLLLELAAAWKSALAVLTEVSGGSLVGSTLVTGFLGFVFVPPERNVGSPAADSRCLSFAKRWRVVSCSSSCASSGAWCPFLGREGEVGFGGDREPRAGALSMT